MDSHALLGACLASAVGREGRFAGVEVASTPAETLRRLAAGGADILVVGVEPPAQALELTREVARRFPSVKVLVVQREESEEHALACLEAGAQGYLLHRQPLADLKAAVEGLARGEVVCTPRAAHALFRRLAALGRERRHRTRLDLLELTPRELEVLRLLAEGSSNRQIAARLVLSVHTVKNHVHSILGKLGATTRWAAVQRAGERGWLEVGRRG